MTFSITIPAYKARFLDEAIKSVIAQTYQDWQLVIVCGQSSGILPQREELWGCGRGGQLEHLPQPLHRRLRYLHG